MKAIYKREVQSYFNSMIGWMFTAALTAFIGIYFMAYNLFQGDAYFSTALGATLFVLMVLVPILTMRSMAEERRSRTDQLLLTAPASVTAVVMGQVSGHADGAGLSSCDCLSLPADHPLQRHRLFALGLCLHPGLLPAGSGGRSPWAF